MVNSSLATYIAAPKDFWWRSRTTLAGYDIGKKGNPSHCSVFAIDDDFSNLDDKGLPKETLIMIHQKFLDNWDYTRQVDYIKSLIQYFNIQRLYYDNTRGEFEERTLPRSCIPVVLSNRTGTVAKGKLELATNFAKLVEQRAIKLLDDDRFISQITCVTNDLQAPNTPRGHGDSFISVMLAVGVYMDFYAKDRNHGLSYLGNVYDLMNPGQTSTNTMNLGSKFPLMKRDDSVCKICGGRTFESLENGKIKCSKCQTIW